MSLSDITLEEVIDTFEFLDDWEDRYKYIIDLGRKLPPLGEDEMVDAFKVRGCQSKVWLIPEIEANSITLRGDSDAHIVKGLVALMLLVYSGKTSAEILGTDAKKVLADLGLSSHLSPMRANGLFSMVERIREIAANAG
ncbi:SufE family protein [Kordiimonas sp. SCSIO 12610]|uniref:SufE family protein n=1 Tax=Kordiimonas sp. SCSIO 12610 TaxID=2829597 RepID=UPI00210A6A5E|nr:SufE family protein [Kordiimonas sp. SCSIO 12610]UTW55242.1 SufE family protein [Kordiimonas sp. SCSIO 12610]